MNFLKTQLTLLLLATAAMLARAGGEEVVVIYNSRVPESKDVAGHYARMRQVPEKQIFGFTLTTNEEMSRAEFHGSLQMPLVKKLEADGFWKFGSVTVAATNGQPEHKVKKVIAAKIRYAALCYGVPLKIFPAPDMHETVAGKMLPELRRNEAAVDSELAWLPLSRMEFPLTGPFPNWLYGATNLALLNPTNGILLVARLDGPTPEIANGLVDKAMQAERDGLWGRAYFDARGIEATNSYFLGDQWILGAAQIARQLGFETVIDKKPETFSADFPMSQIAIYCGWYDGNVSGPFALPKVEFMPGAFAYHLHSYSANTLRSVTENWCGPLLARGVTCTIGCVYDPYLTTTPNVAVFLELLGAGGTFGEAAWAAQPALSWQTTVIGDPLYRPFGKSPQLLHSELSRQHSPLLEWSFLQLANLGLVHGARMAEVASLIDNLDTTTNSAVLTEKLADLYDTQGKPSSAILTWQNALKLNPSPEQRIRLRLTLGEKLQAQGRDDEAVENYQKLLAESPDYPGRDFIVNTLAALRQKSAARTRPPNLEWSWPFSSTHTRILIIPITCRIWRKLSRARKPPALKKLFPSAQASTAANAPSGWPKNFLRFMPPSAGIRPRRCARRKTCALPCANLRNIQKSSPSARLAWIIIICQAKNRSLLQPTTRVTRKSRRTFSGSKWKSPLNSA